MTRIVALWTIMLASASPASATLTFYIDDAAGFAAAVGSMPLLGTEDFESSTLVPGSISSFNDPLAPGVANAPFPTGTNAAMGMTIQSNTLGASPANPSPRGAGGLVTASVGFLSTPTDQTGNNIATDSLDMIFSPAVFGVGFIPLYFPESGGPTTTLTIRVFDSSNSPIGTDTILGGDYILTNSFVGIVATGGDDIGRVNLDDGSASHFVGFDDISAHGDSVPEPATVGLMALGCLLLGLMLARKRLET